MKTVVTTAGRPDEESMRLVNFACRELNLSFVERKKKSIQKLQSETKSNILVAGKSRWEYYAEGAHAPFFFHPNSAAFRLKRLLKDEEDPFIEATQLSIGDSFLDCTLGLASDSIIASYIVGENGKVTGCEVHPILSFVVKEGLKNYTEEGPKLAEIMKRIEVVNVNAVDYLKQQAEDSYDVVYFDPMFDGLIEESDNFQPLRDSGLHMKLSEEWVEAAKRVAKRRVVLKGHYRSATFAQFQFVREVRVTSKFHYGYIDVNEKA